MEFFGLFLLPFLIIIIGFLYYSYIVDTSLESALIVIKQTLVKVFLIYILFFFFLALSLETAKLLKVLGINIDEIWGLFLAVACVVYTRKRFMKWVG